MILDGQDIAHASAKDLTSVRGRKVAAVFQDPMAALSPVHTVGQQVMEPLRAHFGMSKKDARIRAAQLLDWVGVRNAAGRLVIIPPVLRGMAQRVAIAIALEPSRSC